MERRRDYRHALEFPVSLKCPRTRRVVDCLATSDVSASGLSFVATSPHGFAAGDFLEVQLVARAPGEAAHGLVMATKAVVTRAEERTGALRFHAPLAY